MGVMGGYRCMGVYGCIQVSEGVYGCSCVFRCKSKATCPVKNRRCEGVITVDLSSCVYRCLWVFMGVMGGYRCMGVYRYLRDSMGVHGFSDVNQRQRVL